MGPAWHSRRPHQGTAVLEYGPTEILPAVLAKRKALRVSADPVAKPAAHTRAESRSSRPSNADAGERRTLCWREPDSNHRSRRPVSATRTFRIGLRTAQVAIGHTAGNQALGVPLARLTRIRISPIVFRLDVRGRQVATAKLRVDHAVASNTQKSPPRRRGAAVPETPPTSSVRAASSLRTTAGLHGAMPG